MGDSLNQSRSGILARMTQFCHPWAWAVAGVAVITLVAASPGYGIFRDELYYLACGDHLSWGYVDHPPLVALIARSVRATLGDSLYALRLPSSMAMGVLILLAASMARQMGGGRGAELLTAVSVALAPVYLGMTSTYSMNGMDLVFWSGLCWIVIRFCRGGDDRLWLWFGAVAGLGLMNKISVGFLCFGIAIGFLLSGRWREAKRANLWIGAGLAALIFLPHVLWQMGNDWPTLEFIRNATQLKNVRFAPVAFLGAQVEMMNPIAFPLWLTGLLALLLSKRLKPVRPLGWAYLVVTILMLTQAAKPYYLSPIYPVLLAAGAASLDGLKNPRWRARLYACALAAIGFSGLVIAPLARPVLPIDQYVRYARSLGDEPGTDERKQVGRLPQFFADMQGWQELAETVSSVYHSLPQQERARACIFALNYGQAGAIDFFGPELGIPNAICGHNSYWMWGPADCSGELMIVTGGSRQLLEEYFESVEVGGHDRCLDCMPYEADRTIWVARGLRVSLHDGWSQLKHFE